MNFFFFFLHKTLFIQKRMEREKLVKFLLTGISACLFIICTSKRIVKWKLNQLPFILETNYLELTIYVPENYTCSCGKHGQGVEHLDEAIFLTGKPEKCV